MKRANDSLIRKQAEEKIAKEGGVINGAGGVIEWNPFAEDETPRSRPAWASDAALSKVCLCRIAGNVPISQAFADS